MTEKHYFLFPGIDKTAKKAIDSFNSGTFTELENHLTKYLNATMLTEISESDTQRIVSEHADQDMIRIIFVQRGIVTAICDCLAAQEHLGSKESS